MEFRIEMLEKGVKKLEKEVEVIHEEDSDLQKGFKELLTLFCKLASDKGVA